MASSDFDDIFGDLKEDQQFSASLASSHADYDDAAIFGDDTSTTKPTAEKPAPTSNASMVDGATTGASQDEFLSWLDDEPTSTSTAGSESSASKATAEASPPVMDTIDLGDDDDFLSTQSQPCTKSFDDVSLDSPLSSAMVSPMLPSIPVHIATQAAALPLPSTTTISLDDDDDDDLETIVRRASANVRKTGSREGSQSSLGIKSQSHSQQQSLHGTQFDLDGLTKEYNDSGVMAKPAARLGMWHHALCGATSSKEVISMYAVQTTPLDLPNQPALRKDVEAMSSAIFASALHAESLRSSSGGSSSRGDDPGDGSRLLFIDNAEILVTYLCKKLRLAEYPPGFAFTFGPAIAVGGNDPLRIDLLATIQAACHHVMPHLSKQIAPQHVADARRALLKWLLLYHAPAAAFHLDQHFHQWNTDSKTIPDAWLASMFENDDRRSSGSLSLELLVQIWDCCLLLDVSQSKLAATKAFPSTTACFIVVHLIAIAEKKLLRMEGDQLRHCMAQTLVETLQDHHKHGEPLLRGVRALVEATPPSICIKLREAGMDDPSLETVVVEPTVDPASSSKSLATMSLSLLSASTNGVLQVGSAVGSAVNTMVIDMPTKLLTTIVPIKFTTSSPAAKDPAVNEEFFTQLMRESTPSSSVCVTLAASEVIPQVFRSFQTPPTPNQIRYFIIDCRAKDETTQGQIPTAFHFDPDAVTDPKVLDAVLATLTPLQKTVHLCVMGQGYGHIADDLRQLLAAQQSSTLSSDLPFFLKDEFLESFARDISRVNAAVLFLAKRGFPHVSVLEGGYAAAHTQLLHSAAEGFSVADLIDHDAPQCSLCHHRRPSISSAGSFNARTESARKNSISGASTTEGRGSSPPSSRGSSGAMLPQQQTGPKLSGSASGELDARALFDGHASPSGSGSTYFSTFTGALKTGGKAMGGMMNPATATMAGGSKWLMGMKPGGSSSSNPSSPVPGTGGDPAATGSRSPLGGIANLNKLKSSLSQIGSESLDMLKKAEQAAVKTTQLKGMFGSMSSSNLKASTSGGPPGSPSTSTVGSHTGNGSLPRASSFQRTEEEVFTIDDDDEEEQDDFVGGSTGGSGRHGSNSSRTSSTSSMTGYRSNSFVGSPTEAGGVASTVVLHTVEKEHVRDLTKGLRVSRTQMLPFVESPFFSAYKKKPAAAGSSSRASMLPRRLVVAENHVIVLKAERNMDDVYCVKSCHHLSHLGRMTCLKKNALMVTMYYKWKAPHSGETVEKKNAYEVQQRDEFIKVIKNAMEKM